VFSANHANDAHVPPPQIGSFASATPAERKYFESFHSDTLDNYRRGRISEARG
jgi:hypothetical protein